MLECWEPTPVDEKDDPKAVYINPAYVDKTDKKPGEWPYKEDASV